jgi:hypothetical protein
MQRKWAMGAEELKACTHCGEQNEMRGPACALCLRHLGRRGLFPEELALLQGKEVHPTVVTRLKLAVHAGWWTRLLAKWRHNA